VPLIPPLVSPGPLRVASESMDKYDAFQSAYAADLGILGNSLQRWLVRIDHDCQTSWRDHLTRALVTRTVHNIFLAVKAVSYSRRAEVFDLLRTATQRSTREPIVVHV
jgi:phage host-nuclease inhibitor protein Gam